MEIIEQIKNGYVTEEDLLEYVTDNDVRIAIAAAECKNSTGPILDIAARDNDRRVRLAAAKNGNAERKTLLLLLEDADFEVSEAARKQLEG